MSTNPSTRQTTRAAGVKRKGSRRVGLIWAVAVVALVTALLVTEQVALLYVLATLSVVALLVVVALSSFGESRAATEPAPFDDAAAIGDRSPQPARQKVGAA